MGFALTVEVFLAGFASVRLHAHHDRALARYDQLVDRAIQQASREGSYPRPTEIRTIAENYRRDARIDPAAYVTLAVCIAAWGCGTWFFFLVFNRTSPATYVAIGFILVLTLVLMVLILDLVLLRRRIKRDGKAAMPMKYQEAQRKFVSRDFAKARTLFLEVLQEVPRWPWPMLGMARACAEVSRLNPRSPDRGKWDNWKENLADAILREVESSKDPVDRVLVAAAHKLKGLDEAAMAYPQPAQTMIEELPELKEILDWIGQSQTLMGGASSAAKASG
jgi:hypothetical protein